MHLNILSDSLMLTRASVGASCLLRKPNKVRSWEKVICLVLDVARIPVFDCGVCVRIKWMMRKKKKKQSTEAKKLKIELGAQRQQLINTVAGQSATARQARRCNVAIRRSIPIIVSHSFTRVPGTGTLVPGTLA